ncbi:putative gpd superfamily base excision dna repair protein [Diplogelasinospora grovesii]|uniref:Gpd superfamily base excision dna repair protein n=1 Tax=Diplogelasinospora grovesii TaxID=303347 RepID=A0AAN6NAL1_9PEZI|nr:putative gpd superfamily base excision dna repair protein [Diplogelasinospora grovesii]
MASRRSARLVALNGSTTLLAAAPMPPPVAPAARSRKRKAETTAPEAEAPAPTQPEQATPVTPQRRRPVKKDATPPATPTPSAVGLMAESHSPFPNNNSNSDGPTTPLPKKPRSAAVSRLAGPDMTNAPLLSPQTSRLIASSPIDSVSPSKIPSLPGRTTTANILEEACAHLIKVDSRMKPLIEKQHCRIFSPEGLAEEVDPFEALASGIISQQVSGAAAKSIKNRFISLFDLGPENGRFPHPSQVAATSIEKLRTAGLSQRKAEYVQGLAEKFMSGDLSAQMLADAPYEEVLEKLIAVRGLGKWSVEMFACFALKRMDVFSLGDLGVQRGMAAFVGRDVAKLKTNKGGKWKYMTEKEMEEIAERFRPYRTIFMWYMWRVEETDISTME